MSHSYFNDLNYSLSNEDTLIEYSLLPSCPQNVFTIAGSGARVLPLIAKNPTAIDVIDLSQNQLYLTELRYKAAQTLSYEEFLFFLGYRGGLPHGASTSLFSPPGAGDSRRDLFKKLSLSAAAQAFWQSKESYWLPRGFIFLGRWENHFQKIGNAIREYLHCDFSPIFEAQSLEEQQELYQKHWPHKRFSLFLRLAASEFVFDRFLYKGHFSGKKEHSTEALPPWKFIEQEFNRLFQTTLVRKNYFLQKLFLGELRYEEGLPLEAQAFIHQQLQQSTTQINYQVAHLIDYLQNQAHNKTYDFYSFSDTISYLDQDQATQLLQRLPPTQTPSGSLAVIRSFMKAPSSLNTQGWKTLTKEIEWAREIDGTAIYRFHIYQKA